MDPMESSTGLASMALSTDLCSGVVGAAASLEAAGADSVGVGASKSVVGLSPLKTGNKSDENLEIMGKNPVYFTSNNEPVSPNLA